MTPSQQQTIQRADATYKCVACLGFLLDQLADMERLNGGQSPFSRNLKVQAQNFYTQLVAAEKKVTGLGRGDADYNDSIDQLSESYALMDRLLSIMLKAGRTLSGDAQVLLNDELVAVAKKWGVTID